MDKEDRCWNCEARLDLRRPDPDGMVLCPACGSRNKTSPPGRIAEPPIAAGEKKRHGCLTTWLVLMIITNSVGALVYLFGSEAISANLPAMPTWAFPVLVVFSLFNVVCAVALVQWKKWGFWGFCASSVAAFVMNASLGLGVVSALGGIAGALLLYGVLHIGKENKGWSQLE